MAGHWDAKKVLITVRTYPVPATKTIEASCTAGITDKGEWIRLFPIPFRMMAEGNKFSKWQWIETQATKPTSDPRPESHKLNIETIIAKERVNTADQWRARRELIRPLVRKSICEIQREQDRKGYPTLGVFRPGQIKRLLLEPNEANWDQDQLAILKQDDLFHKSSKLTLEKIPFKFKYQFICDDGNCKGHEMSCTDWEMAESYRRWRKEYGADWERVFRQRFEKDMIEKYDTHFFVGTIHRHPKNWIIIGLFYPPKPKHADLFD